MMNTSNHQQYNASIVGGKDSIIMMGTPTNGKQDKILFILLDSEDKEVYSQSVECSDSKQTFLLKQVLPGSYLLRIMATIGTDKHLYHEWLDNIPVIVCKDRTVNIDSSPVSPQNTAAYGNLPVSHSTLKNLTIIPPGNNSDIIKTAYYITLGCRNNYAKILAVHDWIAENIYYDMDSYLCNHINYAKLGRASNVFEKKLAVCAGYSDLAVVMLRALGFPSFSVSCYALGISTTGHWTSENIHYPSNHSITMVYAQRRWIILDTTWDSQNIYQNGTFKKGTYISHRYFDPTLTFFRNTHKLCI